MQRLEYKKREPWYALFLIGYFLFFCIAFSAAQNIPASRRVEWEQAGVQGGIPCVSLIYNFVTDFSGDNTGSTDNASKLNNALINTPSGSVIYFPNGTYRFNATINVPSNKVIRGQSVSGTILNFSLSDGKNCFNVEGSETATTALVATSVMKGGNVLSLNTTSGFSVNDDILIEQENTSAIANDPASWADDLRGQLFVITAISGNTFTLDRTFTLDYNISSTITVRKLNLKKKSGFENFTIDRMDANYGTGNETFLFQFTANCWMKCVRSLRAGRYHVYLNDSRNAEIRGCYFYEAKDYSEGGNGYGVLCQDHVGECLIENNIFRKLRHALIVKEGANRNVYGYNYSREATWTSSGIPADISLHGHYPYYNLFEGNIVQRVTITDAWGKAGPGNTLFRNRVEGTYDIWLQDDSDNQNLEANEVTGSGASIDANRDGSINGTISVANLINGTVDVTPTNTVPNSYYLSGAPSFFGAMPWPAIGYNVAYNSRTIPARARYANYLSSNEVDDLMDHCSCSSLPVDLLNFHLKEEKDEVYVFWQTSSERLSDRFSVERSEDGSTFVEIGSLPAAGNSSSLLSYSFTDKNPLHGILYYRLAQYDVDGSVHYSSVLASSGNIDVVATLYPNPFNEEVKLVLQNGALENAEIKIYDISGRLMGEFSTITMNSYQFGKEFSRGVYFVEIISSKGIHIVRLFKN